MSSRPLSARPATELQGRRTRGAVTPQYSTHKLYALQVPKPTASAPSGPTELDQIQPLTKAFRTFVEKVTALTAHSGWSYPFHTSLAQDCARVDASFGFFAKQAMQQCGTLSALQQGMRTGQIGATSSLRKAAIPFLKKWHVFARSVIDSRVAGPVSILQGIEEHVEAVTGALEQFLTVKGAASTIHDSSVRIARQYQMEMQEFYDKIADINFVHDNPHQVDRLCDEIREYSRRLSESFGREFVSCGMNSIDLGILKTKAYSACSGVIHGVKARVSFTVEMGQLLDSFDEFQEMLSGVLSKLSLPQEYLVMRDTPDRHTGYELEMDEDDDESLDLFGALETGYYGVRKDAKLFENWLATLHRRARNVTRHMNMQHDMHETLKEETAIKDRAHEERVNNEQKTINDLRGELEVMSRAVERRDTEISELRRRESDNEFKQCLREIAKRFNGVLTEETVHFYDDEDDDQLVQYVNALSLYVVERKCVKCDRYAAREADMRKHLSKIVNEDERDEDLVEITRKVSDFWDDYQAEKTRADALDAEINELKRHCVDACDALGKSYTEGDVGCFLANIASTCRDEHANVLENKEKQRVSDMIDLSRKFVDMFAEHVSSVVDGDDLVESNIRKGHIFVSIFNKMKEEASGLTRVCQRAKTQLAKYLRIEELTIEPLEKCVDRTLDLFESMPNPLWKDLAELQENIRDARISMQIIGNRLGGASGIIYHNTDPMTMREVVDETLSVLDHAQDRLESQTKRIKADAQVMQHVRETFEIMLTRMKNYTHEENTDLGLLSTTEIIERAVELCDKITLPSASSEFLGVPELNHLFSSTFPLVSVSSTSNPATYIPEVCSAFMTLTNSVTALKPFAEILNEIFTIVDFKSSAFDPGTQEFEDVDAKVIALHELLKRLPAAKINPVMFNVVERFTTLVWTLLDILSK